MMQSQKQSDHFYMQRAFALAQQAATVGEVPVGAVLVCNDEVIGAGYNQPITLHDPTAHAEIIALRHAASAVKNYRLINTTLYVTLEPCAMCAYALLHARVARLVYACTDPRTGACGGAIDLFDAAVWNHKIVCEQGPLNAECSALLREFFRSRREKITDNTQQ